MGGDAADEVSAPGFHGDGVQPSRRQGREDALVLSGGDVLALQHAVVVADQDHVAVQVSGRVTPVNLISDRERLINNHRQNKNEK